MTLHEGGEREPHLLLARHLPLHVDVRHQLLQNAQRMPYAAVHSLHPPGTALSFSLHSNGAMSENVLVN